jgi:hypothetical protein
MIFNLSYTPQQQQMFDTPAREVRAWALVVLGTPRNGSHFYNDFGAIWTTGDKYSHIFRNLGIYNELRTAYLYKYGVNRRMKYFK